MKLKTVLTAAIISGILMGCSSSDSCEEILPPITPPTNVEQFITLGDTQVKMATRTVGFTNADIDGSVAVETQPIIKEHKVLDMKKVHGYTMLRVEEEDSVQNIYIAKGNGSKFVMIKAFVHDNLQFDQVYFPNTLHNDTSYIMVFDFHDRSMFQRYDSDLNLINSGKLNTPDSVGIATNKSPTIHDEFMTIPMYVGMNDERQVFKYDGNRHQGWRLPASDFMLGVAGDGDIVYATRFFDMGEKFRISYIGEDSIVHEIGVIRRMNVNFGDIRNATTHGRFVSLHGNTIDVLNKQIVPEPTCSFEPFAGSINVGSTEDYFVCPTELGNQGSGVQSFERYDPATGDRSYIQLPRPGKPTRFSTESVTFEFDSSGIAVYDLQSGFNEVDNIIDIVK